jgi:hypothetical protein
MKQSILFIGLMLSPVVCFSSSVADSLLYRLDYELERGDYYIMAKAEEIARLKDRLNNPGLDFNSEYELSDSIFEGYKSFIYDSAFIYFTRLQKIAYQLNDPHKIVSAKIKLGFILLSSGMFKEACDTLETVRPDFLPEDLKAEFYSVMAVLYYGLADLQDQHYAPLYQVKAHKYVENLCDQK